MRRIAAAVSLAVALLGARAVTAAVAMLWSVTDGMDSPESAYYDAQSGFVFVSQIGGDASARDGNGRIVKLTVDGAVVNTRWIAGLNAPKGLRSRNGTLYVADISEIVEIDIAAGVVRGRVPIADAKFLNDVAVAPDGTIYTTDSFQNRVYAITDGKPTVFVEGPELPLPNGILADASRVVVAADGQPGRGGSGVPARLLAFDRRTRARTTIVEGGIGTPDGIEFDGHGGYVTSDVAGGRILHVSATGAVRVVGAVAAQPADICFVPDRQLLIVPHLGPNTVTAYRLTGLP